MSPSNSIVFVSNEHDWYMCSCKVHVLEFVVMLSCGPDSNVMYRLAVCAHNVV